MTRPHVLPGDLAVQIAVGLVERGLAPRKHTALTAVAVESAIVGCWTETKSIDGWPPLNVPVLAIFNRGTGKEVVTVATRREDALDEDWTHWCHVPSLP